MLETFTLCKLTLKGHRLPKQMCTLLLLAPHQCSIVTRSPPVLHSYSLLPVFHSYSCPCSTVTPASAPVIHFCQYSTVIPAIAPYLLTPVNAPLLLLLVLQLFLSMLHNYSLLSVLQLVLQLFLSMLRS